MTKYLRCHTKGLDISVGNRYAIVTEEDGDGDCMIIDDAGDEHYYPNEVDHEGESYRDWFTLETDEGITLIPDESLGGILREYNEVKRKARVGERIKVVFEMRFGEHRYGEIHTVTRMSEYGLVNTDGKWGDGSTFNINVDEYVVLEPTDIIRIDNERFRMVERKASVGERVIALKPCDFGAENYNAGSSFIVEDVDFFGVDITDLCGEDNAIPEKEYRVLEPLTAAVPTLSSLDPVDQYVENIAALTTKVQALEERVATLESYKSFEDGYKRLSESLRKFTKCDPIGLGMTKEEVKSAIKVASGPVSYDPPGFAVPPKQTDQQIRDEIVARAKADVVRLSNTPIRSVESNSSRIGFWPHGSNTSGYTPIDFVEFSVNRDKRTVVAMIRSNDHGVWLRGIAKAAPGEVFNVHIGKAIGLYRALGLEVPAEYMNVPAPTDVRVGDIVYSKLDAENFEVSESFTGDSRYLSLGYVRRKPEIISIIDDSREESEGVSA